MCSSDLGGTVPAHALAGAEQRLAAARNRLAALQNGTGTAQSDLTGAQDTLRQMNAKVAADQRTLDREQTLFEGGVHLVDLLLHLYEEQPAGVYAQRSSGLEEGREADAIQLVTLDFPSGRLAQITIDRLCPAGIRYLEVRADCERASLRASHGGRALIKLGKKRAERTGLRVEFGAGGLAWMEQGLRHTALARDPRDVGPEATRRLFEKVVAAFEENREPPSSAREARATLEVVEAAYRSGDTGARVALNVATAAR